MSAGNSTYSPLPQSNSDSDGSSEEELHVSQGNRIINRATKTHNSKCDKAQNETKNNVINYKPLDNDGEVGVILNKFHSNPDEVSILKPYGNSEIFSTSRKICFVFSLLLCVFTTVAFIWILPCNVGTCPSTSDIKVYNFTWEETLSNLEIYGPSSLISHQKNFKLIFFTRSHLSYENNYSENELWCLNGKNGSQIWKIKLDESHPTDLDCKLIDMNADGANDCLIFGRNSLKAVDSLSGKVLWDLMKTNENDSKFYLTNFPIIVPDMDKDGTNELLILCSFAADESNVHYIVVISGKTGEIINKPLRTKHCFDIRNLMLKNNVKLSYICHTADGRDRFEAINLSRVYKTLKNSFNEKFNLINLGKLSQHLPESDVVYLNDFKLQLVNNGICPENCSVSIDIKKRRGNNDGETIRSYNKTNTYGMIPVLMKTDKETGFIVKFWKWCSKKENCGLRNDSNSPEKKVLNVKNTTKNIIKRSKKLNLLPNSSIILDNEMLLESEREFFREKRTTSRLHKSGNGVSKAGNLNLRVICETIVKFTFNKSDVVVTNIGSDEIIQVCKKPKICQPDAFEQRHSLLIANTDKNESKMIKFTSKYVHVKNKTSEKEEPWQLQSTISVSNL